MAMQINSNFIFDLDAIRDFIFGGNERNSDVEITETQIKNSSLDDISFIYKSQNNNSGIDNKSDYSPLYSVSSQGKNSLEENMPDTSKSKYNLYILILFYYRNGERCRKRK